jgi:hypothetical protein
MFGKPRKTKDLVEGEYLVGKPNKTPSIRVLAYGLPGEDPNITFAVYDHDEYELDDEPLYASVSFLDYNGTVLFAGAFERVHVSRGHSYIECIALSDLDLRQRELFTALRGDKFVIFLVPCISRGAYGESHVDETDLFRRVLKNFGISWDSYKTPVSHVDSKIPEFQPYIERFGSVYVHYSMYSDMREHVKVICGNSDLFAITLFDKLFFLPCTNPSTHKQAIDAAAAAVKAVITYRKRISKAKPQWVSEFRFAQENSLLDEHQKLQKQLNHVEVKIDSYSNYKGVLCYRSDPLVDVVINIFEKFFGITLEKEEKFIEDAILKDEDGNIKGVFEIKGVNKNFARKDINQVDSHRERLDLQPNTPGILIMNTLMNAKSLNEKDQPPHPDIIKKVVADNVMLVRTIDLLRFADGVEAGILKKEDFLATLMSQSGWLKVDDNRFEVVKG